MPTEFLVVHNWSTFAFPMFSVPNFAYPSQPMREPDHFRDPALAVVLAPGQLCISTDVRWGDRLRVAPV